MMNKAINTLVLATVDSLTKFKNKLAYYLAIFAMVFGSTFGSLNTAYADDTLTAPATLGSTGDDGNGDGSVENPDGAINIDLATFALTVDTIAAAALGLGALTGSTGDLDIDMPTGGSADYALTIGSITLTGDGAIDIDQEDISGGNMLVTLSGDVSTGGALTVDSAEDGAARTLTTDFNGDVTVAKASALTSDALGTVTAKFAGDTTFTLGITLNTATKISTFEVDGSAAQTITGIINGADNGQGRIDISNTSATVTFESILGAVKQIGEIESSASSTTVFNQTIDTASFDVDGKVTLTQDGNTVTRADLETTGTIIIDDTVTNGQTLFLGATSLVNDDIAGTSNIKMPANLLDGETIIFAVIVDDDEVNDAVVADVEAAVMDTALRTYTVSGNKAADAETIIITAADNSSTTVASNLGTTTNTGTALIQAGIAVETDATALDAFSNALNAEGGFSATEDTALAKQVAPQDDMISGSSLASKAVTGTVQGIISNRMASLRSGDAYYGMGMSAGNMTAKSGFIQAFGSEVEQKNKTVGSGTQYGYESSSAGFALGFDGTTDTGATVGLSFSMSNTDLDGKGTGKAKNDIDSYTASLYWDKTGQNGYVEGSLTYGLNENKTSRLVNTAGLSRTYTGSYDSNQVSLSLGGGVPNAVGASGYVTPFIGFTGTQITTDAYTESSTTAGDSLRLRVAQDDVNSLVGKVGVKYHNVTDKGTPMISLSLNNEFGDDTINSTNTYQGGGSSFTTSTDVEPLSATLGLGYSYGSDTASIEFAYEAEANDDKYLGHYGSIKIVGKF